MRHMKGSLGDSLWKTHLDAPANANESLLWCVAWLAGGLLIRLPSAWFGWLMFMGSILGSGLGVTHDIFMGRHGVFLMVWVVLPELVGQTACRICVIIFLNSSHSSAKSSSFVITIWNLLPKLLNIWVTFISILSSSCLSCFSKASISCCLICSILVFCSSICVCNWFWISIHFDSYAD